MATLWMLIGVPGSGKSTWIKSMGFDAGTVLISSDDIVEEEAARLGKTYSDIFAEYAKEATAEMNRRVTVATIVGKSVVWDQTNVDAKGRAKKLRRFSDSYRKVAVFFPTPEPEEHARRLANRPGKFIPQFVIDSMTQRLEMPTIAEGFDEVIIANETETA